MSNEVLPIDGSVKMTPFGNLAKTNITEKN